jgi:hypothetical protein
MIDINYFAMSSRQKKELDSQKSRNNEKREENFSGQEVVHETL